MVLESPPLQNAGIWLPPLQQLPWWMLELVPKSMPNQREQWQRWLQRQDLLGRVGGVGRRP